MCGKFKINTFFKVGFLNLSLLFPLQFSSMIPIQLFKEPNSADAFETLTKITQILLPLYLGCFDKTDEFMGVKIRFFFGEVFKSGTW